VRGKSSSLTKNVRMMIATPQLPTYDWIHLRAKRSGDDERLEPRVAVVDDVVGRRFLEGAVLERFPK
jgi:hypothetical protein